ncbi:MAG: Flp family type IVb pilin [Alphaproteobacteria bacterium]|nr:Flp family type IVb pilin [Alphaproteobacteria bacterium]
MFQTIGLWCLSQKGATAIEYGLIAAGIAVAIAASVFAFGDDVYNLLYDELPEALNR